MHLLLEDLISLINDEYRFSVMTDDYHRQKIFELSKGFETSVMRISFENLNDIPIDEIIKRLKFNVDGSVRGYWEK